MTFEFADFRLDPELFELRRRGRRIEVEPRAFDLILLLVSERHRVVGRDELVERLWEGSFVSDAAISTCVKNARQALGDDGRSQTLIQTVRGRGFRFVGETREGAAPSETRSPGSIGSGPSTRPEASPDAGAGARASPRLSPAEKPVVAVLPFDNLTGDGEAYFADGIAEDTIANLSRFRELEVIARTTTFQFRQTDSTLKAFCEEIGAGYVVEGSVRRGGGRLRITVQLIDADAGVHLWADSYDREEEDLFALQDEVTRTIAANLGVRVQGVALQRSLRKSRQELDAYDHVLRARRFTSLLSAESHLEARDLLEEAVAIDPDSSDAHALLANVYLAEHRFENNPREDPVGRAMAAAQTAVALDPQNAYARCWLAVVHFFRHENEKFEEEAERALALNPNDPEILADIGHYYAFMGRFERGTELSQRARELNPLHPGWYFFSFARRHYDEQRYEETLADVQRMALPHFYWSHLVGTAALGQLGRPEAPAGIDRIFELKPDFSARAELRKWNAAPDDLEHLVEGLVRAGLDDA